MNCKHDFNYCCLHDWEWYIQVHKGKGVVRLVRKVNTLFDNPIYTLFGFFVREQTWQLVIPIWQPET